MDRRRHPRFELADVCSGTFRVVRDVVVERRSEDEFEVLTDDPGEVNERVVVQYVEGDKTVSVAARVVEARVVMIGSRVNYRLRLTRVER